MPKIKLVLQIIILINSSLLMFFIMLLFCLCFTPKTYNTSNKVGCSTISLIIIRNWCPQHLGMLLVFYLYLTANKI